MSELSQQEFRSAAEGLLDFIDRSPVSYYVVKNAAEALEAAGAICLREGEAWSLVPGNVYYVVRNGSALIAFRMPERVEGFTIAAAHTDSPCLRVKENGTLQTEGYSRADVEAYGGMVMHTWIDRPLSAAGRLLAETETGVETIPVNIDRDLTVIPGLAIHMDRGVNAGREIKVQTDLIPLLAKGSADLYDLAAKEAGIPRERLLSADLYLYARQKGTLLGASEEFICSPRLDNLLSVYGLLQGFLRAEAGASAPVMVLFDREEVGSLAMQGACSTFLKDVLSRIAGGIDALRLLLPHSFLISADSAHGVHPNHPEKAALTARPKLGDGIVLKVGGGYASDGLSVGLFRRMLQGSGVPLQNYYNHSDIAGGGTLGKLSLAQVPVITVDIGLPELSMHSAAETAGTADIAWLVRAMACCFSRGIRETAPGCYQVV